jgi:prepilin-type N-terminal cleavage/methylation domain-containing protein
MQLRRRTPGFTLTELAIVLAIVGFLMAGIVMTLSVQVDQRNQDETLRRVNAAVDALYGFAIVNRRLPCPARYTNTTSHSQGLESFCTNASGACGTLLTTVQTHGNCSNFYDGYLPAVSLGVAPVDSDGFAVDAWGNRIRYAVARDNALCSTSPPANTRVFTSQANLKTYGLTCRPGDLDICAGVGCATRVVTTQTAVVVVYSIGKNGAVSSNYGTDETENVNADAVFVSRPMGAATGASAFDDILAVVPVGVLYSKMIAAGVMP